MTKFAKIAAVAVVALGGFAFASVASAVSASSIYSPATGFLKMGSGMGSMAYQAPQVMAAQTALNACVPGMALAIDGKMGPLTTAKFKAFQASKMIAQDGIIGPITAAQLAACSGDNSTPSTPSTGLNGGAGDLTITETSTDVESSVKEGSSENVLGLKLEADDSDIEVTNIKVSFQNNSGNGSTRFNKYIDEVMIMLDDEEVASVDASDFSKDGTVYSESISLDGAIVEDGEDARLYVAVKTLSTVDDVTADFDVAVTQIRYEDATGAVLSESYDDDANNNGMIDDADIVSNFDFDDANVDDDLAIKSSSNDPEASNLIVEENNTSDDYMIGAFKFDVDEDSSDVALVTVPVVVTFTGYDVDGSGTVDGSDDSVLDSDAENVIDSLWIEIDGEEFEADLDSVSIANGNGTATYSVDVDEDYTIEAGDAVEVEIYAIFNDQDGNYNSGVQVRVGVTGSAVDAEGEDSMDASGNFTGEDHTLLVSGAAATFSSSSFTAENVTDSVDGTISITFKVEAIEADVVIAEDASDLSYTLTGATETDAIVTVSGMTAQSGDFTISEGDMKTVTLSVKFNTTTGFVRLEVDEVAGTPVTNIITQAY